jgi:hypothetical protein
MLLISCSTFSAVLGSFLCAWALASAQEVGVAQAFPLDQRLVEAEVELHNLSTLVRPLNRDELELVLQDRLTHVRNLLNDIARHEVDFVQAGEARKQEPQVLLDSLEAIEPGGQGSPAGRLGSPGYLRVWLASCGNSR